MLRQNKFGQQQQVANCLWAIKLLKVFSLAIISDHQKVPEYLANSVYTRTIPDEIPVLQINFRWGFNYFVPWALLNRLNRPKHPTATANCTSYETAVHPN